MAAANEHRVPELPTRGKLPRCPVVSSSRFRLHAYFSFSFRDGQAKTVAIDGPSHRVPKLRDVLVSIVATYQLSESGVHDFVLRIGVSCDAK